MDVGRMFTHDVMSNETPRPHDYMCFMMEDMLSHQGKGFITARELRSHTFQPLTRYIGNGTEAIPDLMLAHNGSWRIIDIYTRDESLDTLKNKYNPNPMYTVHLINANFLRHDLTTQLPDLFSDEDLTYLEENFRIFQRNNYEHSITIPLKDLSHASNVDAKKKELVDVILRQFNQAIQAAKPPPIDL